MPAHDISCTDGRSTTWDVCDDEFPDEDAESDYHSCVSYTSDEDEERTAEDPGDGELEILQHIGDGEWAEPYSDVQDLVGVSMTSTEWISEMEVDQWWDALREVAEMSLDAIAVLAETVGGPAREQWDLILLDRYRNDLELPHWQISAKITRIVRISMKYQELSVSADSEK
ncbi:hypothetical protein BDZ89DRAFT_1142291 [Hymenopellis radicata]|nr:hypothetical protein BDZ89DRAFT_1142291 [Hymenopellis radicata]